MNYKGSRCVLHAKFLISNILIPYLYPVIAVHIWGSMGNCGLWLTHWLTDIIFSHVGINFHILTKICKPGRCRKLEYLKIEFSKQIRLYELCETRYFVLWLFYDHWFSLRWIGINLYIYYMHDVRIYYVCIFRSNLFKTQQIYALSLTQQLWKVRNFLHCSFERADLTFLPADLAIVILGPNKLKACSRTWQYLPISLTFHDWRERTQKRNLQLC